MQSSTYTLSMLNRLTRKPLSAEQRDRLIAQFASHIFGLCNPLELILFGSAAKGEFTDGSDLDFALIFRDEEESKAARKVLLSQPKPFQWSVDYLFFSQKHFDEKRKSGGVCELIDREGIRIKHRFIGGTP